MESTSVGEGETQYHRADRLAVLADANDRVGCGVAEHRTGLLAGAVSHPPRAQGAPRGVVALRQLYECCVGCLAGEHSRSPRMAPHSVAMAVPAHTS